MWCIVVLSSFILCVTCSTIKNDCVYPEKIGNEPDYYWRNYFGVIPKDAVPGGYDETGNVTYIGQLHSATKHPGIFLANVYPGQKEAVAAIGKKVVDGTYVKILCSNPANKFEWIKTSADETYLLTDYHLVIGGAQATYVSYIGRANFEGQVQVGRVYTRPEPSKGLWLYDKTGAELTVQSFEVLVLPR